MKLIYIFLIFLLVISNCNTYTNCDQESLTRYFESKRTFWANAEEPIYLVNSSLYSEANTKLIKIISQMGYNPTVTLLKAIQEYCPNNEIKSLKIAAKYLRNLIHLGVAGVYSYTDKELSNMNLINAGTIDYIETVNKCAVDECGNATFETVVTVEAVRNKMISANIATYKPLYKVIQDFSQTYNPKKQWYWNKYTQITSDVNKKPIRALDVLVCVESSEEIKTISKEINNVFTKISVKYVTDCNGLAKYLEHDLLVVVTPKPIETETRILTPTIFYETSLLMDKEKYIHPNSMTLFNNTNELLSNATMKLLEHMNWNRVAIISDDSPSSEYFEGNLTKLLNIKGVVYTVQRSLETKGSFVKVLQTLKNIPDRGSRIIIANVDKKQALKLVEAVVNLKVNEWFVWIWREWPFDDELSVKRMGQVFSMYAAPNSSSTTPTGAARRLDNIIEALSRINSISYKSIKYPENDLDLSSYYRRISELLTRVPIALPMVRLRMILNGASTSNCSFTTSGACCELTLPADMSDSCAVRSNRYMDPCDDKFLLMEMLVIFAFIVALMAISTFFHRYNKNRANYTNL